jgi:hypothetical protein
MHVTLKTRISLLLALVLHAGLSTCASGETAAEEKHTLQYKFEMGEVLRYSVKHVTNIRTTIEGSTQEAESNSASIKAWKVTDVLPNDVMEFVHVVEEVRMSNRVPNRAVTTFDSKTDKTPPPGFEQAARAVGVPLSLIRIKPSGEIVHREEKHPQPAVSDDMPITLRLPDEPIAVGEKWNFSYDVAAERKSGAKLQVRTRRVCTLKSVKGDIATIGVDYQILTPVSAFIESQLIERVTKGTVRFDMKRGRLISQRFDADKRVLGFHGDASSMHFVSRLEEKLLKPGERLARKTSDK